MRHLSLLFRPSFGPQRRKILVVSAVLALALLPGLGRLRTDNSPAVFFVRGSPAVERYHAFRHAFGSDQLVRLVLTGDGVWTPQGLAWLATIEEEVATIPGVESVSSLYRRYRQRIDWPPADPAAFRQQVLANDLDRSVGWIGAEGRAVTAVVLLEDLDTAAESVLLERIEEVLASVPPGIDAELIGLPLLNRALDASSREIEQRYFPLLVLFAVVILLLTVRDLAGLMIPLVFVGFCELLALAPLAYAGVALNMVLAVLPPLLFAIALATALHVLLRYRDLRAATDSGHRLDAVAAGLATYEEKGWSVLWTALTTLIGFASLALSPVAPVRSLGLWTALALAFMMVAAFLFYPALLTLPKSAPPTRRGFERRAHSLGLRWGHWAHRRRRFILLTTIGAATLAVAGLPRLRLESNALKYLASDHPVRTRIESLQARGIGLATVELLLTAAGDGAEGTVPVFAAATAVDQLATLGERLEQEPLVYSSVSAGTLLRDAETFIPTLPFLNRPARLSMVWEGLAQDDEGRRFLDSFLSEDRRQARLTLFVATSGLERLDPLLERVEMLAGASFPHLEVETTGEYLLLLEAQRYLISTLASSLGLTLLAIAVLLRFLLPGTRLTLLALLPSVWPVIGVLGVMGWLDIPLDIATVMVASVILGLGVDDTLHTLGHFRQLAPRYGAREGVAQTLALTTSAYLLTGVILVAGFGVCALSDFAPIARFGALSSFAIALAVLGDLFLLPALLSLTPHTTIERWRQR